MNNRPELIKDRCQVYVIGLTGNIATGKSSVGSILVDLGAQHIDADKLAHQAMSRGEPAWHKIVAQFGGSVLDQSGEINRKALGEIVFSDPKALQQLEAIVHPDVIARTTILIAHATTKIVVIEAIKLIESGMVSQLCDVLWVVTASRKVQIERLVAQRGLSRADAILRIDAQPPQVEKMRQADVIIENNGNRSALTRQVRAVWLTIQNPQLAVQ